MPQNNAAVKQYYTPTATPSLGISTPYQRGSLPSTGFDLVFVLGFLGIVIMTIGLALLRKKP